ncbi:hypothetical protein PLCT2_02679 [Planctomycetaceae bacterium]|nr:hypothetical protein PLCT2_02679 [Planctomycetaceae bacterium]
MENSSVLPILFNHRYAGGADDRNKVVAELGIKVEYVYVLGEWFRQPKYKDVLDYINNVCCHYRFGSIPLDWLGLPVATK